MLSHSQHEKVAQWQRHPNSKPWMKWMMWNMLLQSSSTTWYFVFKICFGASDISLHNWSTSKSTKTFQDILNGKITPWGWNMADDFSQLLWQQYLLLCFCKCILKKPNVNKNNLFICSFINIIYGVNRKCSAFSGLLKKQTTAHLLSVCHCGYQCNAL